MDAPVIVARNISKSYKSPGGSTVALPPTDMVVERGEFVCLTGPSGSGKSTLLGILGLLRTADDGSLAIDGRDCTRLSERERDITRSRLIGLVPQHPRLFLDLSSAQNVELGARGAMRSPSGTLLSQVGLADRQTHGAGTLSGGEQQRLSLARALVNDPSILLADEPTSGLDDINADRVAGLLSEAAARGAAVIVATHDTRALKFAHRTVSLGK